ncbi:hypothetical protein D3C76_1396480 [compost metagenome]
MADSIPIIPTANARRVALNRFVGTKLSVMTVCLSVMVVRGVLQRAFEDVGHNVRGISLGNAERFHIDLDVINDCGEVRLLDA